MTLKDEHVFGVLINNTKIFAQTIKDSKDLLLEFFIDNQFYDKQIVKPGQFWYNWFLKQINEAPKK